MARGPAIDRLLWRAGFGPSPAERRRFRGETVAAAVETLLHPPSRSVLAGPAPRVKDDETHRYRPLLPFDRWGEDVLWWLDRMVRTRAPLVERMTLNLHDHFATSNEGVGDARLMIAQNGLLRRHALGSFDDLCRGILHDTAMGFFLDVIGSRREAPNENFARELMELFTLGSGYDERDIREAARALTGFDYDWEQRRPFWNESAHDPGVKTIFGQRGRFRPDDVVRLCVEHPAHAPFLCAKLWSYFSPEAPEPRTLARLVDAYRGSGRQLRPLLRAILTAPQLYASLPEPDLVKPPVVFLVGALRATGTFIDRPDWVWLLEQMGQLPFYPPNVGGWDQGEAFLSTMTLQARWTTIAVLLQEPGNAIEDGSIRDGQPAAVALAEARRFAGQPWTSRGTSRRLATLAHRYRKQWKDDRHSLAERARVLRHLLLAGPNAQVH